MTKLQSLTDRLAKLYPDHGFSALRFKKREAAGGSQLQLLINDGKQLRQFVIDDNCLLGRFSKDRGPVDIDLSFAPEAGSVSRHHARLFHDTSGWRLQDLGSVNGTRLDDLTIAPNAPVLLYDGAKVCFGLVETVVKLKKNR